LERREAMRTWLRSVVDTILGRVQGKLAVWIPRAHGDGRGYQRSPRVDPRLLPLERDDGYLIKPIGPSADNALFEQQVRIVNEAHERDA
jgi:hypothetical protein